GPPARVAPGPVQGTRQHAQPMGTQRIMGRRAAARKRETRQGLWYHPLTSCEVAPCRTWYRTCLPCARASTSCWCVFDVAGKQAQLAALEAESGDPEFWADPEVAQRAMRQIAELRAEIAPWLDLRGRVSEQAELLELALAEGDEALAAELAAQAPALADEL